MDTTKRTTRKRRLQPGHEKTKAIQKGRQGRNPMQEIQDNKSAKK